MYKRQVYSRASMGVQAPLVTIEVHLSNGKPGFTLVGLPEKTVKEAQDRVRSALINAQFKYPAKRITVNQMCIRDRCSETTCQHGFTCTRRT